MKDLNINIDNKLYLDNLTENNIGQEFYWTNKYQNIKCILSSIDYDINKKKFLNIKETYDVVRNMQKSCISYFRIDIDENDKSNLHRRIFFHENEAIKYYYTLFFSNYSVNSFKKELLKIKLPKDLKNEIIHEFVKTRVNNILTSNISFI